MKTRSLLSILLCILLLVSSVCGTAASAEIINYSETECSFETFEDLKELAAKEYTYVLQSLPKWLTQTYGVREDVMGPLGAYGQSAGMAMLDWVRMFVRLFILVFINLFEDPQKMTAMVDRLSPLMVSVLPIAYMVGYLLSPRKAEKIQKLNRRAKKVAVRRAERRKVAPELLGAQNQVHYGHKKEEKARKKKELI